MVSDFVRDGCWTRDGPRPAASGSTPSAARPQMGLLVESVKASTLSFKCVIALLAGPVLEAPADEKERPPALADGRFAHRGAGIRTRDLLLPKQARYRTAPHPESYVTSDRV